MMSMQRHATFIDNMAAWDKYILWRVSGWTLLKDFWWHCWRKLTHKAWINNRIVLYMLKVPFQFQFSLFIHCQLTKKVVSRHLKKNPFNSIPHKTFQLSWLSNSTAGSVNYSKVFQSNKTQQSSSSHATASDILPSSCPGSSPGWWVLTKDFCWDTHMFSNLNE